jgi:hypothetical protein
MFAHKWYLGTDHPIDPEVAAKKIDGYLKILNDDYRVERVAAIRHIIAEIYPSKVFYDWMRICGKEGSQNKFPRVLRNEPLQKWEDYLDGLKK